MTSHTYVEDLFLDFVEGCRLLNLGLQPQDVSAVSSFYSLLQGDRDLTQAQASYIIKILKKYPSYLIKMNLDLSLLDDPLWKKTFRVLDHSKKIFVETGDEGIMLCVQHPFSLKETFEKVCIRYLRPGFNSWSPETKIRKYNWYSTNPVLVKEFAQNHGYEITLEFIELVDQTEEIWNNFSRYEKLSKEENGEIVLVNATDSATNYFKSKKTTNRHDNLLLAKSLGHRYNEVPTNTLVEKISKEHSNNFWIQQIDRVIELFDSVEGKICIISSRDKVKSWLQDFISKVESKRKSLEGIRVCFRENNSDDPDFNSWIKNKNLGGDVSSGRIFIFKEKLPKWLIENDHDVKIVILNGAFPPSSANAQQWLDNHCCVVYTGSLRPSLTKGKDIVEL